MRGPDIQQDTLFSTVSPEARVPKDHPLRPIRSMVDAALKALDRDFDALYSASGRDSIPEKLLRAQLLMALYTIRSERQLMEQIDYNLLFRWFVGFSMDDAVWDHSTFAKNRDRLLGGEIAKRFFARVLIRADRAGLLSTEHFSVDGTLIEALASLKSSRPKDEEGPPSEGGAIRTSISMARRAVATPMYRRQARTLCCTGQGRAGQAGLPGASAAGEPPWRCGR